MVKFVRKNGLYLFSCLFPFLMILEIICVKKNIWQPLSIIALLLNLLLIRGLIGRFSPDPSRPKKINRSSIFYLLAVLAVSFFFHFYQIRHLPSDLYGFDAARDVRQTKAVVENKELYILYHNFSKEPLYYLLSAAVSLAARDYFLALKLTAATFGVLATAAFFFLTLYLFSDRLVAFFASLFFAFSSWPLLLERLAYRAALIPLVTIGLIYFLISGLRENSLAKWFYAGLCLGLGFYIYTTWWIVVPVVALLLATLFFQKKKKVKDLLLGISVMITSFIVVFLPLFSYISQEPNIYFQRISQRHEETVGLSFSNQLKSFGENYIRGLNGIAFKGPHFPFYENTAPFSSAIDRISLFYVLLGLIALSRNLGREEFLLTFFLVFLAPIPSALMSVGFTLETPNFSRLITALPGVFLLSAMAISAIWKTVQKIRICCWIVPGIILMSLVASGRENFRKIFVDFPKHYPLANFPVYSLVKRTIEQNPEAKLAALFYLDPEVAEIYFPQQRNKLYFPESIFSGNYGETVVGRDFPEKIKSLKGNNKLFIFHMRDLKNNYSWMKDKMVCQPSKENRSVFSQQSIFIKECLLKN